MTRYFRFTDGGVVWPERKVNDGDSTRATQVAVIDFEDREQVELFEEAYRSALDSAPANSGLTYVMQAALREFANPQREVYEHFATTINADDGFLTAYCGKVWKPSDDVTVTGRCPSCEEIVAKGWTA